MTSPAVNVLRWSALAFGVFYGFSHQRTIYSAQQAQHDKHEWDQKQKLINQAKSEYARLKKPATSSSGDEATFDPNSPKFDLEKLLEKVSAENP